MAQEKLYLYISDIEAYLKDEIYGSFRITEDPPDDKYIEDYNSSSTYGDMIFLQEITLINPPDISFLTDIILARLERNKKEEQAKHQVALDRLDERKQRLMSIPYLGDTNV